MLENNRTARRFFASILAALPALALGGCSGGGSSSSAPPAGQGPGPMLPALFEGPVQRELFVGSSPGFCTADVTGDGRTDLVIPFTLTFPSSDVRIAVLPGLAGGGYGDAEIREGFGRSETCVFQDLNGDSRLDLVTLDGLIGELLVFLRRADGSFADAVPYSVGTDPGNVVLDDLNGDTIADAFVPNDGTREVAVLLGRSDGTFERAVFTDVPEGAQRAALGHLDADGFLDAVVTGRRSLGVLRGRGDGTFEPPTSLGQSFSFLNGLALADATGNGQNDVVAVDGNQRRLHVFEGDGLGGFVEVFNESTESSSFPGELRVADLDGDPFPEIVVANGGGVLIFRGSGSGNFDVEPPYLVGPTIQDFELLDQNGDGNLDVVAIFLVFQNPSTSSVWLAILEGTDDGSFGGPCSYEATGNSGHFVVGLFDADPVLDVVVAERSTNSRAFLRGVGDGSFEAPALTSVGRPTESMTAGDANGNTLTDLVVTARDSFDGVVSTLASRGDGTFDPPVEFPTDGLDPIAVGLEDVTGDTIPDLITVHQRSNKVGVHAGLGGGDYATPVRHGVGLSPTDLGLADFNRDGGLDVVVTNQGEDTVSVLLSDGVGGFLTDTLFKTPIAPLALAVADLNLDGFVDVATTSSGFLPVSAEGVVTYLPGRGDGTLGDARPTFEVEFPFLLAAAASPIRSPPTWARSRPTWSSPTSTRTRIRTSWLLWGLPGGSRSS